MQALRGRAPSACLSTYVLAQPKAPGTTRSLAVGEAVVVVVEVVEALVVAAAALAETGGETNPRDDMVAVVEVEATAATESS